MAWDILTAVDLRHFSSREIHATLRVHDNLRHSDDGAVAVTVVPFLALHQLGGVAVQPGLQPLRRGRMHLRR